MKSFVALIGMNIIESLDLVKNRHNVPQVLFEKDGNTHFVFNIPGAHSSISTLLLLKHYKLISAGSTDERGLCQAVSAFQTETVIYVPNSSQIINLAY